jgi:hypothetical protein
MSKPQLDPTLEASAAAADLARAAQRFVDAGAAAYLRKGRELVGAAQAQGCRFLVEVSMPKGEARVELVTGRRQRTQLFAVALNPAG